MNRNKFFILAVILMLLTGCERSAALPLPSNYVTGQDKASSPTQPPAVPQETRADADRLPEGISDDFMAFIKSEYGTDVYEKLIASFESDSNGSELWHKLTGCSLLVLKDLYSGVLSTPDTARSHRIWLKVSSDPNQVVLSFAGDLSFADGYANMSAYHTRGGIDSCILPNVKARMSAADIMMINNEFCYSRRGYPLPGKAFTFRADPAMVQNLHTLSVDLVSLANNHVYDYGPDALLDTLDTLSAAGIIPIVYSLGNFWFNSKTIPTGLVEATVTPYGLNKLQFIPCIQKNCTTDLIVSPDKKQSAIQFIQQLSPSVIINGEGIIHTLLN
ncbi:CapA family protein [Clostridium boliviensis]|uniref:CapA family protein n=1 Tax=Clostridium boliviensis TaxID=318465 RepID=A0ABU4GKT7_9CLOT|nr:CapA family protein [Clostridium boliviensis]MDW2798230.1 CapA family protein [Clostridium boliviensis]